MMAAQPIVYAGAGRTAITMPVPGPEVALAAMSLAPKCTQVEEQSGGAAVFFDFDGTLSVSMFVQRFNNFAVSDNSRKHILAALSPEEVVDNFRGPERIKQLHEFLGLLKHAGVKLIIVSHGQSQAIS